MKVAAIQHDIVWQDGDATRARIAPMITTAAEQGARLVALSEMYATGFSMDPARVAEPEGGPNEQFLIDQAREHDLWLIASIAQTRAAGRPRNVAVIAGPRGELYRYAKVHPFSYAGEDAFYEAGAELITIEIDGLRVSPLICYDLRFADTFWALGERTDLFVVVANWPQSRREHWQALLRARAIENQTFVLGVNRVGSAGRLMHAGDSAIIDPAGATIVSESDLEAVLVADVEAAEVARIRAEFAFLPDRRQPWRIQPMTNSVANATE